LTGIDPVAGAYLSRTDARHFAGTNRIENCRSLGSKLERVAIAAGNERRASPPLLGGDRGSEQIVSLVARRLGIRETACRHEFGQRIELLDQGVIKLASALVRRKFLVPIGGDLERVPGDQHGTWLLLAVEPQQQIGKAENGTGGPPAGPQYRLRQRMIGAVRKRISVDRQQGPTAGRRFLASRLRRALRAPAWNGPRILLPPPRGPPPHPRP